MRELTKFPKEKRKKIGEMREMKGKGRKYKVEEELGGTEKKGEGTIGKKVN